MSQATPIEWTDVSWNPVRGCTRISPGCEGCYAETMAARFSDPGMWGHGFAKRTAQGGRWTGLVNLIPEKLGEPLAWRKPRRCFVNSTSDLFHERLPFEAIAAVYGIMMACQGTTFQVLTKRARRRREFHDWLHAQGDPQQVCEEAATAVLPEPICHLQAGQHGWPLPNVWEGVSVESADYLWRVEEVLNTPAALRFVSYEPALGPVDFTSVRSREFGVDFDALHGFNERTIKVDWVIVGGESGPNARPFEVEWARSLIRQCRDAGVPIFVKQLGAVPYEDRVLLRGGDLDFGVRDRKGGDMSEWPEDLRIREFPEVSR